jgi:hypothetical protein
MDSLEPWQAEKIIERLQPSLAYLNRLRRRMESRGFPPRAGFIAWCQTPNGRSMTSTSSCITARADQASGGRGSEIT